MIAVRSSPVGGEGLRPMTRKRVVLLAMSWIDGAGRSFTLAMKELKDWRGNRADAGRIAPKGFPKNNKFRSPPTGGKSSGTDTD